MYVERSVGDEVCWKKNILSRRGVDESFLSLSLKDLTNPMLLPDMKKASQLAILNQYQKIVCVVDYDTDGVSSGAVLKEGLIGLGFTDVEVLVTDRHAYGYGFSMGVVNAINVMERKPALIITADLGSSDGERLAMIDIPIIVTDHHHISETTPPKDIAAFVNPHRKDVEHEYHHPICGAGVAWNFIAAIRNQAREMKHPSINLDYDVRLLLDIVAVATIADMVPLNDPVNRVLVKAGLKLINKGSRPAWLSLRVILGDDKVIREDVIGYHISPRVNALSRMGDKMNLALDWLLSKDMVEVSQLFSQMSEINDDRKEEQGLCESLAMEQALAQNNEGFYVLVCFVPQASHGVVGLAAGRVAQHFGKPAIVLSSNDNGEVIGSARSIPGYDIRDAMLRVNDETGLLKKYGGHAAAAGLTLSSSSDIPLFHEKINAIAAGDFGGEMPLPKIYHDGFMPEFALSLAGYNELMSLGPFGQGFPQPSYLFKDGVCSRHLMGSDKTHLRYDLSSGIKAVWFNHQDNDNSDVFERVVTLNENVWRGNVSLQLMVVG